MSTSIINKEPWSGRVQKEDNSVINIAEIIEALTDTADTLKSKLDITGAIVATTTIDISVSGTGYTKSGDTVYLGASAAIFNANTNLRIFLNGYLQNNGIDVIFVSAYSFYFIVALKSTDTVIIIKPSIILAKTLSTLTKISGPINLPQITYKTLSTSTKTTSTITKQNIKTLSSSTKTTSTSVKTDNKILASSTKTATDFGGGPTYIGIAAP